MIEDLQAYKQYAVNFPAAVLFLEELLATKGKTEQIKQDKHRYAKFRKFLDKKSPLPTPLDPVSSKFPLLFLHGGKCSVKLPPGYVGSSTSQVQIASIFHLPFFSFSQQSFEY